MSFHGGLIGVIIATIIFSRIKKINFLNLTDIIACAAPIGLLLGRIANFINGEIYGMSTGVERFQNSYLRARTPLKGLYLTGVDVTRPWYFRCCL